MGVVRRYIDILTIIINFPYSTCISSFLAAASLLLCSFLKYFFVRVLNIECIALNTECIALNIECIACRVLGNVV